VSEPDLVDRGGDLDVVHTAQLHETARSRARRRIGDHVHDNDVHFLRDEIFFRFGIIGIGLHGDDLFLQIRGQKLSAEGGQIAECFVGGAVGEDHDVPGWPLESVSRSMPLTKESMNVNRPVTMVKASAVTSVVFQRFCRLRRL